MKKIISLLLVLVMIVTISTSITVSAAATTLTMTGKVVDPASGSGTLTLTFKTTNNTGLYSLAFNIGYNASTLSLQKIDDGVVFGSSANTNDKDISESKKQLDIEYTSLGNSNTTENGIVVKVTFDIIDDRGNFDINFNTDDANTKAIDATGSIASTSVTSTSSLKVNTQHNYQGLPSTIPATCTEYGYSEKKCIICGNVLEHIELDEPLGHEPELIDSKAATCAEEGYEEYECVVCNEVYRDVIPKLDHTPGKVDIVDATETATGSKTVYCMECGEIISEEVIPVIAPSNQDPASNNNQPSKTPVKQEKNPNTVDKFKMIVSLFVAMLMIIVAVYYIGKNDIKLSDVFDNCKKKCKFFKK